MRYVALCRCGAVKVQLQANFRPTALRPMQAWLTHTVKAGAQITCGCKEAKIGQFEDQVVETKKGPAPKPLVLNNVLANAVKLTKPPDKVDKG